MVEGEVGVDGVDGVDGVPGVGGVGLDGVKLPEGVEVMYPPPIA